MQVADSEIFGLWVANDLRAFPAVFFMILKGYVDESYREDSVFTIAGVFANGLNWARFESKWKRLLAQFNRKLRHQGRAPITRFKSADLSNLHGEFEGWNAELRTEFTKLMLSAFVGHDIRPHSFNVLAYSIPLTDLNSVFPEWSDYGDAWRAACYFLTTQTMIFEFARFVERSRKEYLRNNPAATVRLPKAQIIYDDCAYRSSIERGFETARNTDMCRDMFIGISRCTWKNATALQAADFVAYETYKELDRRNTGARRPKRASLEKIGTMPEFSGNVGELAEDQLRQIRALLKNRTSSSNPSLGGIC